MFDPSTEFLVREVRRDAAVEHLEHDRLGGLADPRKLAQRALPSPLGELDRPGGEHRGRRATERLDLVGLRLRPLEQERDPAQRAGRIGAGPAHSASFFRSTPCGRTSLQVSGACSGRPGRVLHSSVHGLPREFHRAYGAFHTLSTVLSTGVEIER